MALIERERQLAELAQAYVAAASRHGRVALVDGGVASGKTELVHAAVEDAAARGAQVRSAAGSLAESTIPLGIIGQLCPTALDGAAPDISVATTLSQQDARLLDRVCQTLLDLAEEAPLVLVVDDVQFADPLSLHALLYLQRRIRAAKVLLVLSGCASAQQVAFRAELTRQPHCHHIRLQPLTRDGVEQLLATRLPDRTAAALAGRAHELTGGSPILAHALLEDHLATPGRELAAGDAFVQAAVACLHRSDPTLLAVARAAAVLGSTEDATDDLDTIAALTGQSPVATRQALDALAAAGLRKHRAVNAAILADCSRDLRLRAARLLHEDAASASEVAGHLVAAGVVDAEWQVSVLAAAAEEALAGDAVEHAIAYLELALTAAPDQPTLRANLVRALWRHKPAAVIRHLDPLAEAAAAGRLDAADLLVLTRVLAWHGKLPAATEIFAGLTPDDDPEHAVTAAWLRTCAPGGADVVAVPPEQVLQRARPADTSLVAVWQALRTMVHTGQLAQAESWCEQLSEAAAARQATSWCAVLADVRAAVALHRGDLAAAEAHANTALDTMSARGWGIAIGSPLAHLVVARTMTGQLARAEEALRQITPAAMRQSLFWPQYLRARGVYYTAADRPHAALTDFQAVGEHVVAAGMDDPAVLPWRVDLARVHLKLGRPDRARELVRAQLDLPGTDSPRTKGMALRVLAAACEPKQRQVLLREATDLLHAAGDRHELAHAFADLSQTGHALGEFGRAKMMGRRAMQLAKGCHAEPLRQRLQPTYEEPESSAPTGFAALSEAERRVVNLAARGHTNREIGNQLFITVSTVEQHLTRAYRKLKITRRTDLVPIGTEAYA